MHNKKLLQELLIHGIPKIEKRPKIRTFNAGIWYFKKNNEFKGVTRKSVFFKNTIGWETEFHTMTKDELDYHTDNITLSKVLKDYYKLCDDSKGPYDGWMSKRYKKYVIDMKSLCGKYLRVRDIYKGTVYWLTWQMVYDSYLYPNYEDSIFINTLPKIEKIPTYNYLKPIKEIK